MTAPHARGRAGAGPFFARRARALLAVTTVAGLGYGAVLGVTGTPAGATAPHAGTVTVATAQVAHVGTVLTTASGLTLYRFTEDPAGSSMCTGACAKIWPPLLAAKGAHVRGPKGVKGLSLIKVGGHWQVAFHDVALYRYEGDKKKGQANGQDVGHVWFAVLKSGIPAATAAAGATGSTSTSAPSSPTTNPPTTSPQGSHAGSGAGTQSTPAPVPMQVPATPATTPPTSPPTTPPTSPPTTPPTSPPTTTPTTAPSGGGYGY